jgi:hypothetical protein
MRLFSEICLALAIGVSIAMLVTVIASFVFSLSINSDTAVLEAGEFEKRVSKELTIEGVFHPRSPFPLHRSYR